MAGIDRLAAEIKKREPKLDILVNNAGAAWGAEFDEFPGKRLGQGDEPQRQDAVLPDQGAGRAAARGRQAPNSPAKVINIASIDGIFVNPAGDLFLRREQGRV